MDSGNSSMQSSSGGDEEYDSRSESVPSFFNPSSNNFGSLSDPHPSIFSHQHNQLPTFFDPSSNYLHAFSQPQSPSPSQPNSNHPNSLLNLDLVGSSNLQGTSSTSHSILAAQGLNRGSFPGSPPMQSRLLHDDGARSFAPPDQINVVKNPKKRTRASRRAPTTVLTTDTSNFRAMVQEFTGIPAQPFSGSSYTRRLDLFGSGIKAGHFEPMGPLYPLRPLTQKFQPNPFVSSSSSSSLVVDAIAAASTSTIGTSANENATTTSVSTARNTFNSPSINNFQLLSDLGLNKETHSLLNMQQNPVLSSQSVLQPPLNPSDITLACFNGKSQASFGMPGYEGLATSGHGHVNASLGGLSSHVASGQDHMRPFVGNINGNSSQRATSCKLNYSASSLDFHHDKTLENVSSRGEGTVDSWICPSE
ncbi:uncharacterized serine-rich protein C215.13-like [Mangifera indica]|uniref:uncharacterized serine-rich protein C215.13-like n=1 Tax=Mangifera indica TaxID=29780 RepID=UPI001CFAAEDD|nr:uncharacterized serine-rich protein C215.13-like [Mangifera indica]